MKVALVHDDIVQWGGAERVLLALSEIYPEAPIFTSLFDAANPHLAKFKSKQVITSFMQKIPAWKSMYKTLLPLYPIAFEQFDFSDFDLVISHTTRFAKSIITKPQTLHICYCHTPPRFLWHFSGEGSRGALELLLSPLRLYDRVTAQRPDYFIAGSENAKNRIRKVYGRESKVVYPFVDLERFKDVEPFDGGYFAIVGRESGYKNFQLAQKACQKLKMPLKAITGGLKDEEVVLILSGCKALIVPGIEDFGLASLEAQALGKPVVAYGAGGALETLIDGKTGILFSPQTQDSLLEALEKLDEVRIDSSLCRANARRFSKEEFVKNFKQTVASLV